MTRTFKMMDNNYTMIRVTEKYYTKAIKTFRQRQLFRHNDMYFMIIDNVDLIHNKPKLEFIADEELIIAGYRKIDEIYDTWRTRPEEEDEESWILKEMSRGTDTWQNDPQ